MDDDKQRDEDALVDAMLRPIEREVDGKKDISVVAACN